VRSSSQAVAGNPVFFGLRIERSPKGASHVKLTLLVVCGVLALSGAARAQVEGVADFAVTTITRRGEAVPGTGKVSLSRSAYRMEWQTDASRIAFGSAGGDVRLTVVGRDSEPDRLTLIDDATRTYSFWDLKKARGATGQGSKYTVTRLGPDTVAGLTCQKAELVSSVGTRVNVCVAGQFGASLDWLAVVDGVPKESTSWISALRDNGLVGFPIHLDMRRKDAPQPFVTLELTRLARGAVPAAAFEVPHGYKQSDLAINGLSAAEQKAINEARAKLRAALGR
jgi:hypothetical protein